MMFEKQVDVMNQMVDSFISDNNVRNEEFNNQVNKIPFSNIHMYWIMLIIERWRKLSLHCPKIN